MKYTLLLLLAFVCFVAVTEGRKWRPRIHWHKKHHVRHHVRHHHVRHQKHHVRHQKHHRGGVRSHGGRECHAEQYDGLQMSRPARVEHTCDNAATHKCQIMGDPHLFLTGLRVYHEAMKFGYNWMARFHNGNYHFALQSHHGRIGRSAISVANGVAVKLPHGHVLSYMGGVWKYNCQHVRLHHNMHIGGAHITTGRGGIYINVGHGTSVHVIGSTYLSITLHTKACNLQHSWGWCSAYFDARFRSCSSSGFGKNIAAVRSEENLFHECHRHAEIEKQEEKQEEQNERHETEAPKCTAHHRHHATKICKSAFKNFDHNRCPVGTQRVSSCAEDICLMVGHHHHMVQNYVNQYVQHYRNKGIKCHIRKGCGRHTTKKARKACRQAKWLRIIHSCKHHETKEGVKSCLSRHSGWEYTWTIWKYVWEHHKKSCPACETQAPQTEQTQAPRTHKPTNGQQSGDDETPPPRTHKPTNGQQSGDDDNLPRGLTK